MKKENESSNGRVMKDIRNLLDVVEEDHNNK